jgi:hypothetical protein
MKKERDALAIRENSGLGRTLGKLLDGHQREPDLAQNGAENGSVRKI